MTQPVHLIRRRVPLSEILVKVIGLMQKQGEYLDISTLTILCRVSKDLYCIVPNLIDNCKSLDLSIGKLGYNLDTINSFIPLFLRMHRLTSLNISNNHIVSEGTIALTSSLSRMTGLTHLYINGIYSLAFEQSGVALEQMFSCMTKLTYLDFSRNNIDALIPSLVHMKNLTYLNLSTTHINADNIAALGQNLIHLINLRELDLSYSRDFHVTKAETLVQNLLRMTTITKLNLVGVSSNSALPQYERINESSIITLVQSLKHMTQLTDLDLSENFAQFNDHIQHELVSSLVVLTDLTALTLRNNYINAEHAIALALNFKYMKNLTKLYLGRNFIGPKGATAIGQNLIHLINLTHFCIGWNNIGSQGGKAIAEGLTHLKNLKYLDISYIDVYFDIAKILAQNITHLKNLTYLNFISADNYIDRKNIKRLIEIIAPRRHLKIHI